MRGAEEDQRRDRWRPACRGHEGLRWMSPRGPVTIDTRDDSEHLHPKGREGRRELYNMEFVTIPDFKDPSKVKN
jgi:hypothetical protein